MFIWNLKNKINLILLLLCLFGCENSNEHNSLQKKINPKSLENGMLICRLGKGFFSNQFREYASKDKKYSHIGIISIENDSVFVYHAEASEFTGIGFVKREEVNYFLDGIKVYDFFKLEFPNSTKSKILHHTKEYYINKTPFDLDFDSFNEDKVYCTELIANSMNKALDSLFIIPTLILNGKKVYALDDIYHSEKVTKINIAN